MLPQVRGQHTGGAAASDGPGGAQAGRERARGGARKGGAHGPGTAAHKGWAAWALRLPSSTGASRPWSRLWHWDPLLLVLQAAEEKMLKRLMSSQESRKVGAWAQECLTRGVTLLL